jgi:hypothetical protein
MGSDINEKKESKITELAATKYLVKTLERMQAEIESLKLEIRSLKRIPSGKIGIAFMVPGVLALVFSILSNSNILAFVGLGLTFWGALFFFVRPIRYVESSLLDSTAISTYTTIDRIVKDLKFEGKSYYIPPYPKEVYLPEYLKGLKETVVFISADDSGMPSVEELAKSKFLLQNPNGICVTPPGLGLLAQFEKELKRDVTGLQLNELCENLPHLIVEDLQLAKDVEIKEEDNNVYLKIFDSTYKGIYTMDENLRSVHFLGCPLVSAIACAIAKATGKIVTIQKDALSLDSQTIEVWYRFVEG